jgi:hypothetical protein
MKQAYEPLEMEVIAFEAEDVITTSGEDGTMKDIYPGQS